MTLGNLLRNTTVQGDIHLSWWKDGEIIDERYISGTEDLYHSPELAGWKSAYINYIFSAIDGLHIEVEKED